MIDQDQLTGIGMLMDCDYQTVPALRYAKIRDDLRAMNFAMPDDPCQVTGTAPRLGAYILPNCQDCGTLETLLIECAENVYPSLLRHATDYVDAAKDDKQLLERLTE